MSTGRLKASTNRVRTSTTLQGNSMWTNTIGAVDPQAGSNSVIEASLNAPQFGGGRAARRAAAQEAVAQTGGFDSAVSSYEGLLSLARSQGAVGGQNRGACKRCGQLGHLTKQCRNFINLAEAEKSGPAVLAPVLPPVAEGKGEDDSSDLSLSSSDSDSDSSSSSSGEERRRRKEKEKKRKRKKEKKEKARKSSKHKKKHKKEKGSSHKKRRKASPGSD